MQKGLKYSRTFLSGAVLLLSLASIALAAPSDWPQLRGPNRDGISPETGLLQDLPTGGPPLVWKATSLGVGYCTGALIEASPEGFKEHGRFEQPDRSDKKAWPYPAIAHGRLYLRDGDTLLCYDVRVK